MKIINIYLQRLKFNQRESRRSTKQSYKQSNSRKQAFLTSLRFPRRYINRKLETNLSPSFMLS